MVKSNNRIMDLVPTCIPLVYLNCMGGVWIYILDYKYKYLTCSVKCRWVGIRTHGRKLQSPSLSSPATLRGSGPCSEFCGICLPCINSVLSADVKCLYTPLSSFYLAHYALSFVSPDSTSFPTQKVAHSRQTLPTHSASSQALSPPPRLMGHGLPMPSREQPLEQLLDNPLPFCVSQGQS